MVLSSTKSSECECILNKWIREKCVDMDLLVVNDVPILAEDCLNILTGTITKIKDYTDKLIVTTIDNKKYTLESFNEMNILH